MPTYTSQYPPAQSSTYVKATTYVYYPYYATDPTKSLIGSISPNSWISSSYQITNQRFHIDLGSAKVIRRIYYENQHHYGTSWTDAGVENFTFWGSNTYSGVFNDLVYGNDEGWTQLTVSQNTFDIHITANQADPKYITVTNSTAYRYYAFKFADNYGMTSYMAVRRIELQTEDVVIEYVGTGSLTYSGVAEQSHTYNFIYVSSGDFVTSGSGICHYEKSDWEYAGSGELTYSGEATQFHTKDFPYNTSGSFIYSGEATISYLLNYLYVGDGQFTFSGTATQIYSPYYFYEGSGVFIYSGKAFHRWGDWSKVGKGESNWNKTRKVLRR